MASSHSLSRIAGSYLQGRQTQTSAMSPSAMAQLNAVAPRCRHRRRRSSKPPPPIAPALPRASPPPRRDRSWTCDRPEISPSGPPAPSWRRPAPRRQKPPSRKNARALAPAPPVRRVRVLRPSSLLRRNKFDQPKPLRDLPRSKFPLVPVPKTTAARLSAALLRMTDPVAPETDVLVAHLVLKIRDIPAKALAVDARRAQSRHHLKAPHRSSIFVRRMSRVTVSSSGGLPQSMSFKLGSGIS